jgi:hypothetical protein
MPTPRPIIVARVGPTVGIAIRWPSRPMTSLLSVGDLDRTLPRLPPTATWTPAFRAGAVVARRPTASSSVTSPLGMSRRTGVNAVVPSLLTSPEALLANGSGAEATWGALDSAL